MGEVFLAPRSGYNYCAIAMTPEHTFFEDLLSDAGERLDAYFDPHEFETRGKFEDEQYWHRYRRQVILQTLEQAMPEPLQPLIELGCGAGTVTTYLNEHGFHTDYADVHREALEVARARARLRLGTRGADLRFIRLDLCRQDLPRTYRGVFLFDVLEHLPDDVSVLTRVRRAFDPGDRDGLLMFTVPAFPALWSPWDDIEKHKRRYTAEGARRLAEASGFEVERITYFFLPLFFAAAAVKILRRARDLVRPAKPAESYAELAEAKSHPLLNTAMLGLLSPEKAWLAKRNLPIGTSLLCVARPR